MIKFKQIIALIIFVPFFWQGTKIFAQLETIADESPEINGSQVNDFIQLQYLEIQLAQAINYLEAYDLEIGLLINFGAKSLEFKRIINKKINQIKQRPILKS